MLGIDTPVEVAVIGADQKPTGKWVFAVVQHKQPENNKYTIKIPQTPEADARNWTNKTFSDIAPEYMRYAHSVPASHTAQFPNWKPPGQPAAAPAKPANTGPNSVFKVNDPVGVAVLSPAKQPTGVWVAGLVKSVGVGNKYTIGIIKSPEGDRRKWTGKSFPNIAREFLRARKASEL